MPKWREGNERHQDSRPKKPRPKPKFGTSLGKKYEKAAEEKLRREGVEIIEDDIFADFEPKGEQIVIKDDIFVGLEAISDDIFAGFEPKPKTAAITANPFVQLTGPKTVVQRSLWMQNRQGLLVPGAARCQAATGYKSQCSASARKGFLTCATHQAQEDHLRQELGLPNKYFPLVVVSGDIFSDFTAPEIVTGDIFAGLNTEVISRDIFAGLDTETISGDIFSDFKSDQSRKIVWLVRSNLKWKEGWKEPVSGQIEKVSQELLVADNFFDVQEDIGIHIGPRGSDREFQKFLKTQKNLHKVWKGLGKPCYSCFSKIAFPAYKKGMEIAIIEAKETKQDLRLSDTWRSITESAMGFTKGRCLEAKLPEGEKAKVPALVPLRVYLELEIESEGDKDHPDDQEALYFDHPHKKHYMNIADEGSERLCGGCVKANKTNVPKEHGNRGFGGQHPSKIRRNRNRTKKAAYGAGRNACLPDRARGASEGEIKRWRLHLVLDTIKVSETEHEALKRLAYRLRESGLSISCPIPSAKKHVLENKVCAHLDTPEFGDVVKEMRKDKTEKDQQQRNQQDQEDQEIISEDIFEDFEKEKEETPIEDDEEFENFVQELRVSA